MYTYTKSILNDFNNNVDTYHLHKLIKGNININTILDGIVTNNDILHIVFLSELLPAELVELDNIIANYIPIIKVTDNIGIVKRTVDPTANDDDIHGYYVGTKWINVTTKAGFFLLDSSFAAAKWILVNKKTLFTTSYSSVANNNTSNSYLPIFNNANTSISIFPYTLAPPLSNLDILYNTTNDTTTGAITLFDINNKFTVNSTTLQASTIPVTLSIPVTYLSVASLPTIIDIMVKRNSGSGKIQIYSIFIS